MSPILPPVVARIVNDRAADDAIIVADGGSATVYMARFMRLHGERRVLSSFNHGAIGAGLGHGDGCLLRRSQAPGLAADRRRIVSA